MRLRDLEETLRNEALVEQDRLKAQRRWRPSEMFRTAMAVRVDLRPKRGRRDDFVIAGLGAVLGIGCAVFPWYIFMNPDKFGIRAIEMESSSSFSAPTALGSSGTRPGAADSQTEIPPMKLDLFATGTVEDQEEADKTPHEASDQPFPGEPVEYRMVYAATGRAMIADDSGFWVVQRGSVLPDNSKVAKIEQRKSGWVLVTSDDKVIELSAD